MSLTRAAMKLVGLSALTFLPMAAGIARRISQRPADEIDGGRFMDATVYATARQLSRNGHESQMVNEK